MISINISELIWTVINFFLLFFLLNRFLYKPVISFMEGRQARIDAKLREEEEARARIEENDARLQEEKARSREAAKKILAENAEEIEKNNAEVLNVDFMSTNKLLVVIPNARTSNEVYVCKSTEKQTLNG